MLVAYALIWYAVLGIKPVNALVKVPVPVPSLVLVSSAVVGFALVPQQTPRAVTAFAPWPVILPPDVAVVAIITDASVVVRDGVKSFTQRAEKPYALLLLNMLQTPLEKYRYQPEVASFCVLPQ